MTRFLTRDLRKDGVNWMLDPVAVTKETNMHTCKDCEKCDVRDICPVYEIGGWLKEHENSVKIAVDEEIRKLASCCHII